MQILPNLRPFLQQRLLQDCVLLLQESQDNQRLVQALTLWPASLLAALAAIPITSSAEDNNLVQPDLFRTGTKALFGAYGEAASDAPGDVTASARSSDHLTSLASSGSLVHQDRVRANATDSDSSDEDVPAPAAAPRAQYRGWPFRDMPGLFYSCTEDRGAAAYAA